MKTIFTTFFILFAVLYSTHATNFYLDPVNGSLSNNGSINSPWPSLQEVVENNMISSNRWQLPYTTSSGLIAKNSNGPVKAGDVLLLKTGYHGIINMNEYINTDYITIKAMDGHDAKLGGFNFVSGGKWRLEGLSFSSSHVPEVSAKTLVQVSTHSWTGPVYDFEIINCKFFTVWDASSYTAEQWSSQTNSAINMESIGGLVSDNHVRNVKTGIVIKGEFVTVKDNLVENFSGDGMRGLGNDLLFEYNTVRNSYEVDDYHSDGFQSWSLGTDPPRERCILRGNKFINNTDPNQPFKGNMQGIGMFDGWYNDWIIENNLVMSNTYHGITLWGANNCKVINNIVVDLEGGDQYTLWIQVDTHKNGQASSGNIIRNNLCHTVGALSGATADHNVFVSTTQFDDIFVDFDNFNLHPTESSPTIDAGSSADAPSIDADGISRPYGSAYDAGAYEYVGAIVGVTGINLSPTTLSLGGAETYQFNAEVLPANASNQGITWTSSNPTVASVDNTGKATTLISGTTTITATTNDGSFTASCTLTVGSGADYNLALNQPVSVTDEDLPGTPGTNLVDGDISDVARWSAEGFPQSAEIDLGEDCSLSAIFLYTFQGRSYHYIVEAKPEGGSYSTIVDRSANTDVSQPFLDPVSGVARFIKITVTGATGYTGTWVSVSEMMVYGSPGGTYTPVAVTGVSVSPSTLSLAEGETGVINALVSPTDATNNAVSWSTSNASVASVSTDGTVTAMSSGSAIITATTTDGGFTSSCNVTVSNEQTQTVTLNPIEDAYVRGGTYGDVNYGSSTSIEVKTTIIDYTRIGYFKFDLSNIQLPVASATLKLYLESNDGATTHTIKEVADNSWSEASITYNNKPAAGSTITSGQPSGTDIYVEYDVIQLVENNAGGLMSFIIEAINDDNYCRYLSRESSIPPELIIESTAQEVPVSGVSVSPSNLSLEPGGTANLTESVSPLDADDKTVSWQSNNTAIATVDATGTVTAISEGTATITVTTNNGGFTDQCNVTVCSSQSGAVRYEAITASGDDNEVRSDGSLPYVGNTKIRVGGSSSGYDGAAVFPFQIPVIDQGEVIVSASLDVNLYRIAGSPDGNVDVYGLPYSSSSTVNPSDYWQGSYGTDPNGTAVDDDFADLSSPTGNNSSSPTGANNIAAYINAQITSGAQAGDYIFIRLNSDISDVSSYNFWEFWSANSSDKPTLTLEISTTIGVDGVSLSTASLSLDEGQTATLTATVTPSNASDKSVSWLSDNPSVASVDANGAVSALSGGQAIITATTNDGGFTAQCTIAVSSTQQPIYRYEDIIASGYDNEVRSDGSLPYVGNTKIRVGGSSSGYDGAAVFPFQIPSIEQGEVIVSASLDASLYRIAGSPGGNVDAYGLPYRSVSTVYSSDYWQGSYDTDPNSTGVQEDFATIASQTGIISSSAQGAANLAAYINAQIASGAQAGDYIFIRLNSDISDVSSYNFWEFWSANSSDKPVLHFEIAENPAKSLTTKLLQENKTVTQSVRIWPNPLDLSNDLYVVIDDLKVNEDVYIQIIDISGKLVYSNTYLPDQINKHISIQSLQLPKGIYVLSVRNSSLSHSEKLLIK